MLDAIFATKLGMTQAWSKSGKRLAVTKCKADDNLIVGQQDTSFTDKSSRTWNTNRQNILEVGFGIKKLNNMKKPLQQRLRKSGFTYGVKQIKGIHHTINEESPLKTGDFVSVNDVLAVGDVVKVQGTSKGRGFAGAVKRYGFHGGPATHGQSDRQRAVGSIGSGTYPGRVWKGKRMPGHFGMETKTVHGLVVLHINSETKEIWLSGPVPGSRTSIVKIQKTGGKRKIELDLDSVGLAVNNPASESEVTEETKIEQKAEEAETVEEVKEVETVEEVKEVEKVEEVKEVEKVEEVKEVEKVEEVKEETK
ncbi:MAG: 50S ribosomal protein L3 [Candidatus Pacebacteria bacterium RIFOXYB1_FULL_39_46]|nr:MAG: 50S ribosomal protein L3 [Candidatus Pacebacteria bacterium RIFOXYB1_FULL_39_46]OGJ39003.1 MAG: 50S ribosomal protein L3 [Candidatus Pacebacteria bacterium RIFOXYA1_FULL_38_18]OGJ39974.1 MAG: 50S ribosomal protein L3 [Candidatus Pacebacteria bacterium RIFOXYD1_FULL_39_27]OGJ40764.1 MAG: 50S ribosomal protein L3 [Candidatus Pacebacteria bacterium RIFOXYC1_FULL_39_21]